MDGVFRIIVAGGRDFTDYEMFHAYMDRLLIFIAYFPADWDKCGKSAGFRRNTQMAESADALVAFWDGNSPGTKHMIETARSKGLAVRIKRY